MRYSFWVAFLTLVSCSLGQNHINAKSDLEYAIAFGVITELNNFDLHIEKDLLVRLYQAPQYKENCFKETHGICQYKYFASVSTYDEYPQINIFELETIGEITKISWLEEKKPDYVELLLEYNKYTKEALANNKDLKNKNINVKLILSADALSQQTM